MEFAIAGSLLILIMAGIVQFCWTQHCASSLRFAMTTASRSLMLNPKLTETDYVNLVKSKLTAADANVNVSLSVATVSGRKVATATGSYDRSLNLIMIPSIPIHYSTTVVTYLPVI